jgi:hypothetical protein
MSARMKETVEALREAVRRNDLSVVERLLADDVRWHRNGSGGCHNREQVLATLRGQLERGVRPRLEEARAEGDRVLLRVRLSVESEPAEPESTIWFALSLDEAGRIVELQDYSTRAAAEHDLASGHAVRRRSAPCAPRVARQRVGALRPSGRRRALGRFLPAARAGAARHLRARRPVRLGIDGARERGGDARPDRAPIDPQAQGVLFYLYARDLVGLRDHLVVHGVTAGEIVDGSPGPKREMRITDPDANCLMVAQIDNQTIIR